MESIEIDLLKDFDPAITDGTFCSSQSGISPIEGGRCASEAAAKGVDGMMSARAVEGSAPLAMAVEGCHSVRCLWTRGHVHRRLRSRRVKRHAGFGSEAWRGANRIVVHHIVTHVAIEIVLHLVGTDELARGAFAGEMLVELDSVTLGSGLESCFWRLVCQHVMGRKVISS